MRRLGFLAASALLVLVAASAFGDPGFETPPAVRAKDLVAPALLHGTGFRVDDAVHTDGVIGVYTIHADAKTFRDDAGTYQVRGRELLEIRLSEMPALAKLEEISKTRAFATAVGAAAVRPLEATGNMLMNPVDTAAGVPGGVARLFDRVESGAARIADSPGDSSDVAAGAATTARDLLGYEQERRRLAKSLGVDPYTSNPLLATKLDEVAWAAFAGRLTVSTAISVAVPGSTFISGVQVTNDLVWDTPRDDLVVTIEKGLRDMNVPPAQVSAFTHSTVVPLSLQVAVVDALRRLGDVAGRADVVAAIAATATEPQARFLATSLRILAEYQQREKALLAVTVPGPLVGRDRDGGVVVPAPVDYLSWTERVAAFTRSSAFTAAPRRTVWLAGKVSPRTRTELEAGGWAIRDAAAAG